MNEQRGDEWTAHVEGIRRGSEAAAKAVVTELFGRVHAVICTHLPYREEPEDMAQEVFMRVFSRIDQYRGEQPFDHWVMRITRNICYDHLRKQRCRPELRFADLSETESAYLEATLKAVSVEPSEETSSAVETVDRLLQTLKPREQVVIRMMDLEEHSAKEISAVMGWSVANIKVIAHRARKRLRAQLESLRSELP